MSKGFKKCDIGLGILEEESKSKEEEGKANSTFMTPAKWKNRIEQYFEMNGYRVLIVSCLRRKWTFAFLN